MAWLYQESIISEKLQAIFIKWGKHVKQIKPDF